MKIEAGDLVRYEFRNYYTGKSTARFSVVTRVTGESVYGRFYDTEREALEDRLAGTIDHCVHQDELELIEKGAKARRERADWTTTGTCKCSSRDLFARGCKCGAIVRYADRAMA